MMPQLVGDAVLRWCVFHTQVYEETAGLTVGDVVTRTKKVRVFGGSQ